MNRDQAKAAVKNFEVIKAFAEGKSIQCRDHTSGVWHTATSSNPNLTHSRLEFRVKPEPQYLYVVEDKSVRVSKYVKVEED